MTVAGITSEQAQQIIDGVHRVAQAVDYVFLIVYVGACLFALWKGFSHGNAR